MPARLLTLKHSGFCRKCRQTMPRGSRAYWQKGIGVWHITCDSESRMPGVPETEAPESSGEIPEVILDYPDIRTLFKLQTTGKETDSLLKRSKNRTVLRDLHNGSWKCSQDWVGASVDEMSSWLQFGYRVPGLKVPSGYSPERPSRRIMFGDEGELQIDLALSGYDYPFQYWETREQKPGLSIGFNVYFQAGVRASVIAEYQLWIAELLTALESDGYDLEVTLNMNTVGVGPNTGKLLYRIRVKKENEASDFTNWSPMFSPSGFRHLCFTGLILGADRIGKDAGSGLGRGPDKRWAVEFDSNTRKLQVKCPYIAHEFPRETLTEQVREILGTQFH